MFFQGNSIDYKRSLQLRQIRPNSTNMIFVVHIWGVKYGWVGYPKCNYNVELKLDGRFWIIGLDFFVVAPLDQEYALAALKGFPKNWLKKNPTKIECCGARFSHKHYKGSPSKTTKRIFSVEGGYSPVPLSFFGQNDFSLGVPPNSAKKNRYFWSKTPILGLCLPHLVLKCFGLFR